MTDTTQQFLDQLLDEITKDEGLDLSLKEQLSGLITVVSADPTPGNLDALAIVMEKIADSNEYREAMTTLQNLRLNNEVKKMFTDDSSTQE